jgi:hypothetical protein
MKRADKGFQPPNLKKDAIPISPVSQIYINFYPSSLEVTAIGVELARLFLRFLCETCLSSGLRLPVAPFFIV